MVINNKNNQVVICRFMSYIEQESTQLQKIINEQAILLEQEIAHRKTIENELRSLKAQLNVVLDTGRINYWEWDSETKIFEGIDYHCVFSNQAQQQVKSLIGNLLKKVYKPDRKPAIKHIMQLLKNKSRQDAEFRLQMPDGRFEWFGSRAHAYLMANNKTIKIVGVLAIISELKNAQIIAAQRKEMFARVLQVNYMNEVGFTLAHELGQPLAVINAYIDGCMLHLQNDTFDKNKIILALKKASEQVDYAGKIIHGMKNMVPRGALKFEKVSINDLFEKVLSFYNYEFCQTPVEINFNLADNLPFVNIDIVQIKQVIINLLNNGVLPASLRA
jgi:nitrogen-specific signal transduction histidine kinase